MLLFFVLLFTVLPVPDIFAQQSKTDCVDTALYDEDAYVKKVQEQLILMKSYYYPLQIFTDKDMKTALRFQQQYCCEREVSEKTCEGKLDGKKYYPESPYLFDHLINVWMRKFDGIEEHCDILGIDCFTRDNAILVQERREKLRAIADETDGTAPARIFELFKDYRWDIDTYTTSVGLNKIANAYLRMCNEAWAIRDAVKFWLTDVDSATSDGQWLVSVCRDIVQQRFLQEAQYVQSLMVEKWVQYVYDNMYSYMMEYFIANRMNAFVDKFGKLDACFNMVLKYVTKTSCCVN